MEKLEFIDERSLNEVESRRKKRRLLDRLSFVFIFIAWSLYVKFFGNNETLNSLLMLIGVISIPGFFIIKSKNKSAFLEDFKENLVKPNIEKNFKGFKYRSTQKIGSSEFDNSGLFCKFNRFDGDDLVEGKIGRVPISFSEINVAHVKNSGSKSGSSRHHIFNGLFLVTELPFTIESSVFIRPRVKIEKIPKLLRVFITDGQINPPDSFKSGSEHFDQEFTLASKDREKALAFLDSHIIESLFRLGKEIKEFNSKLPKGIFYISSAPDIPIHLSVVGNKLYIGASGIRLFDPNYKKDFSQDASQLNNSFKIILQITAFAISISKR